MVYCFSCGAQLASGLEAGGALRCHDCRVDEAPIRRQHVDRESRRGRPVLTLVKTFPGWAARPEPPLQPAA
jgi:hypothetical protein